MSIKFRPVSTSKRLIVKHRRLYNVYINYNFLDREKIYKLKFFPYVYNIGSQLHYLADHAPEPVRQKWKTAYQRFTNHYRKF
jgi:hypothetical protein